MEKELSVNGEIILYSPAPKGSQVEVRLEGESIWLTQAQMAEVFGVSADSIGVHLRNIYASKELNKKPTTEVFSVVRLEGKRLTKRTLTHYNLDAIISV